jgi:ketoreductase
MKLTGKSALITGGSSGIGLAIARRLGRDGAKVAICGRSVGRLTEAARELASDEIDVVTAPCDVRKPSEVDRFVARVVERLGEIDILVNNAGSTGPTPLDRPDDEAWRDILASNLDGPYYLTTRVLPHMPDGGRMIYISSVTGKFGAPGSAGYSAAKHGLIGLVRTAALELAPRKITANALCPGWVETEMAKAVMVRLAENFGKTYQEFREAALRHVPLNRMIEPDEVAGLVRFLVSEEARNITGQAYNICGGQVMH